MEKNKLYFTLLRGVAVKCVIFITVKATSMIKNQVPMNVVSEVVKCHSGFWDDIFNNFDERRKRLQNNGWWLLFLSTAIFHLIFRKFNYIF